MRRGIGILAAVGAVLALGPRPALAQSAGEVRQWPLRELTFPIPIDRLQAASLKPTKFHLYVAPNRGGWKLFASKTAAELDVIDREKNSRGFKYTSPGDGEYDFALQLEFADGSLQPRTGELVADQRVVFDTRPPSLRVAAVGTGGVEWSADDENLGPDAIRVEVRWQGETKWTPISPRQFRPRDSYTWNGLTPRDPLEVRITARDRAGLEMTSRIMTLPTSGGGAGLGPDPSGGRAGFGGANDFAGAPEKSYSSSRTLTINSRLTKVTRSGVRAAHLWMNDGKAGWTKVKNVDALGITANTPDPNVKIEYTVAKDGLHGFIVIPENGAGNRDPDPRPDAQAQFLIEVDTERPFIKIMAARVIGAGVRGPKVEIEWESKDNNLWPEPIILEYAEDRASGEWKTLHPDRPRLPNNGRFVWEVEDKNLWKVHIRARALDMASLEGQHVWEKEVIIDLEVPKATIDKVQGGGPPPPYQAEKPAEPPMSRKPEPTPAPTPPPTPPVGTPMSLPKTEKPVVVPETKPAEGPVVVPKLPEGPPKS